MRAANLSGSGLGGFNLSGTKVDTPSCTSCCRGAPTKKANAPPTATPVKRTPPPPQRRDQPKAGSCRATPTGNPDEALNYNSDACCGYDCCPGSSCARFANNASCSGRRYPDSCYDDQAQLTAPHASNCFKNLPGPAGEPGASGSWVGFDVNSTSTCGTDEYYKHMKESQMVRESPTSMCVCVNRQLDIPFEDVITPEKPEPVALAGVDVFGTINMHSSARNMTTDIRGEALTHKPLGPPPEGAGVSGYAGKFEPIEDLGHCKYNGHMMDPTCGLERKDCSDLDIDDSANPHPNKRVTFKCPEDDVYPDGNVTGLKYGRNDGQHYSAGCSKNRCSMARGNAVAHAARSTPMNSKKVSMTNEKMKNWWMNARQMAMNKADAMKVAWVNKHVEA